MHEKTKRRVVYTALIGDYEEFSGFSYSVDENTKLVLFTGSDRIRNDHWNIVRVKPRFPNDSIRSARFLKIMGPSILGDADQSLWIDNTVRLKTDPDKILDELLKDANLALPYHSFRASVVEEFGAVQAAGYDDFATIYEQLFHYQQSHPEMMSEKVFWTAILARNHMPSVKQTMLIWWEQVLRYSRRDQLSINYALAASGLQAASFELDNYESEMHE